MIYVFLTHPGNSTFFFGNLDNLLQHTLYLWKFLFQMFIGIKHFTSVNKFAVPSYCRQTFLWRLVGLFLTLSLTRLNKSIFPSFSRLLPSLVSLTLSHFTVFLQFSTENSLFSWSISSCNFLLANIFPTFFWFLILSLTTGPPKYLTGCCVNTYRKFMRRLVVLENIIGKAKKK